MSTAQVYEVAFKVGGVMDSSLRKAFGNATSGLSDLGSQSKIANASMVALGAAAVTAGAAIAGLSVGLGASIKAAGEFNASMKQIEASTDSGLVSMKEMKEISTNLYNKNLGQDWNDLAEAISATQSVTALSGKELEAATANALVYRDVFGEEVSQSVKATDTMMRNFGITSTEAYNLLAQGAQNGLNKSDELLDTANEYSPYFKSLGFNANQMFDTFIAGAEKGAFNLDKVGDAVKEFNIRSKDGSDASAEAFQALGMDAAKMSQIFAAGGPEAQKSFRTVVQAISGIEDPVKKNAVAVGLFGTQAEDLEKDVIAAMGTARSQFDMTRMTMEQIQNIKYDTLGMAWQGIARQIETGVLIPIGERLLPILTSMSKTFATVMPSISTFVENAMDKAGAKFSSVKDAIKSIVGESSQDFDRLKDMFREVALNIGPVFSSIASTAGPLLKDIGSTIVSAFAPMYTFWQQNGPAIVSGISSVFNTIGSVIGGVIGVVQTVFTVIKPIINQIISFIGGMIAQIVSFWNTNGAQIVQAVQNVFSGISAIVQFLAPVIIPIITMVWNTIKGLIQGAVNVIMGVIKIFSGLFTGDLGKMWEGAKQLFIGAIQVIWNYLNLMFIGRVITGIKTLAVNAVAPIRTMWGSIKSFFTGGATNAWQMIVNMGTKIKTAFTSAKDSTVNIAKNMWTGIKKVFDDIVSASTSLPGRMGEGIKAMAGKALSGITAMGNKLLTGIGKIVNGVIKGLNTVLKTVSPGTALDTWAVPQYAKGTGGHPGGLAKVNDGAGRNYRELIRYPNGQTTMFAGRNVIANLPKGTQVLSGPQTAALMSGIPAYKDGTISSALSAAGNWASEKISGVKDAAFDVFSYISDPAKLLNKVLEKFGVEVPNFTGTMKNIASGSLSFLKEKSLGFLKKKLEGFSGLGGNFKGAGAAMARQAIQMALSITGQSLSWLPAMMKIAQHESGFNPRAINLWDINAKRGIPSKGMFQTIDPTFNAYKMPGMNNIYNPVHNAVAAIRYMMSRYGGIGGHPGIRSMAKGGGYKPYYKGGRTPNSEGWSLVGERGPELLKLPGGTDIFNNRESSGMLSGLINFAKGNSGQQNTGNSTVNKEEQMVFAPQITLTSNTPEQVREEIDQSMAAAFEMFKQWYAEQKANKQRLQFAD